MAVPLATSVKEDQPAVLVNLTRRGVGQPSVVEGCTATTLANPRAQPSPGRVIITAIR